jgi:hypothetical protein
VRRRPGRCARGTAGLRAGFRPRHAARAARALGKVARRPAARLDRGARGPVDACACPRPVSPRLASAPQRARRCPGGGRWRQRTRPRQAAARPAGRRRCGRTRCCGGGTAWRGTMAGAPSVDTVAGADHRRHRQRGDSLGDPAGHGDTTAAQALVRRALGLGRPRLRRSAAGPECRPLTAGRARASPRSRHGHAVGGGSQPRSAGGSRCHSASWIARSRRLHQTPAATTARPIALSTSGNSRLPSNTRQLRWPR